AAGLGAPGPDDVAQAPQPAPTGTVTDPEIDATLDGYGQWIQTDDYGPVWRPDATVVGVDFTPYESGGSWVDTDAGWAFSCDYPWGWLPFHYGRWAWFHDYWGWVPGHRWGPAWVDWRHGNGVIGWRPRPPRILDHRPSIGHHGGGVLVRDHRHAEQHDAHWRFATTSNFARPHVRSHLYGNLAEGLRVTSKVAAPPLRARTTVRAADLMRNRFSAGGRPWAQGSGRFGGQVQVRDHRGFDPARGTPPGQAVRPGASTQDPARFGGQVQVRDHRGFDPARGTSPTQAGRPIPPAQDSGRFGSPQVRDHRGFDPRGTPPPTQAGQPTSPMPPTQAGRPISPMPSTQEPGRFGGPQVRDHRGADPARSYPPPGAYRPPVYRPGAEPSPPARTYQPYQPPARTYQPPPRTYQPPPPPVRTFQPPPRSAPMPSAPAPSHTWSAPSHVSSPPASAPSHSSSPPASAPSHSSAPSSSGSSSSSSSSSHGGGHRR
ncbi:MAG TPA: DUF6600 domain-containing protein, partial [Kofleriaceae bacterium]